MTTGDDIRIGDAERDAVTAALHDHFAAGRLDRAELDERLEAALSARTRGDLNVLVRDLPTPTGLPEPEPPTVLDEPGRIAWRHHHPMAHPMAHHHMVHRHGRRFPAFPLLLGVFLVLTFTVGPGAGLLAVLQAVLVIWVVRAVLLATRRRHSRT